MFIDKFSVTYKVTEEQKKEKSNIVEKNII